MSTCTTGIAALEINVCCLTLFQLSPTYLMHLISHTTTVLMALEEVKHLRYSWGFDLLESILCVLFQFTEESDFKLVSYKQQLGKDKIRILKGLHVHNSVVFFFFFQLHVNHVHMQQSLPGALFCWGILCAIWHDGSQCNNKSVHVHRKHFQV